jgi:uncharacterized protein (TIGR02246 family)
MALTRRAYAAPLALIQFRDPLLRATNTRGPKRGTTMRTTIGLLAGGLVLAVVVGYLVGQPPVKKADEKPAARVAKEEKPAARVADANAIRKAGQSFVKAYADADAKALSEHWTVNGEYFADDGTSIRGRAKIEAAYKKLFEKRKGKAKAEIEVTEVRFPSKDTAIVEGYFKVRPEKGEPVSSRYTIMLVREDGKWLMAVVREWPGDGDNLRDLEWLIGSWEAKRDGNEVKTTYKWWGDKSFIRADIIITRKGNTSKGFQMIGKDAATGEIRSWTFDEEGSFGQGTWERDGNRWKIDAASVLDNGSTMGMKQIITRLNNDTFTFQAVERSLDGEDIDDIAPIRVTRVKGKEAKP